MSRPDMRRLLFGAMGRFAVLLAAVAAAPTAAWAARATLPAPSAAQVALTDADMMAYLGAQRELAKVIFRLPNDPEDGAPAQSRGEVATILRRYGFASLDAYRTIARSIALVLEGVDPQTRAYVGADAMLRRQLADLDADPSASPDEREAVRGEIESQIKRIVPIQYPANIALVMHYLEVILALSPFGGTAYEE